MPRQIKVHLVIEYEDTLDWEPEDADEADLTNDQIAEIYQTGEVIRSLVQEAAENDWIQVVDCNIEVTGEEDA